MSADPTSLYAEAIRRHAADPQGAELPSGQPFLELSNPLCGDRVRFVLQREDTHVASVACQVRGCALCLASGSMLVEAVAGQTVAGARELAEQVCALTQGAASEELPSPLHHFAPVVDFPERARCVSLPWEALLQQLDGAR